jgi:hypothetical protein
MLCRCSISFEEHQTQNMAPLAIGLMLNEQSPFIVKRDSIICNIGGAVGYNVRYQFHLL